MTYPNNATNGHPIKDEIAVAKIANAYLRPNQAAIPTVLKYLKTSTQ